MEMDVKMIGIVLVLGPWLKDEDHVDHLSKYHTLEPPCPYYSVNLPLRQTDRSVENKKISDSAMIMYHLPRHCSIDNGE
jgi:hypothetical protein